MIYAVTMTFEHSATVIINAKSRKEAEEIATEVQFSDHPQKLDEFDGMYGALLSVDSVNRCSINEIKETKS